MSAPPVKTGWSFPLAMILVIAALGATLWIRSQLVSEQESVLEGTVRRFELTGVLGRPENRSLRFREIENLVLATENRLIREVNVVKLTETEEEVTVHPFYADTISPQWREEKKWLKLPVGQEEIVGYLYIDLDKSTIHVTNAVIAVLGLLLSGGLGLFLLREKGQERRIDQLSHELEARRNQVVRLEKLALAGQLSASMLHDIKKPVLNIKHEIDDAIDGYATDYEEVFRTVSEQTELFLRLLRDAGMESFVNATSVEKEWCDLEDIVQRSIHLVQYERGDVETSLEAADEGTYLIEAVPHQLIQVFSNLILNAYQVMKEDGIVRIRLYRRGENYDLRIEDSGPGIPPDKREILFQPFITSRSDEGGSGLGLYICRQLIEEHGGRILIDSSEELGGAAFVVTFPAPPTPEGD